MDLDTPHTCTELPKSEVESDIINEDENVPASPTDTDSDVVNLSQLHFSRKYP